MPTVAWSLIFYLPLWNAPPGLCFLLSQSEFLIGHISPSSPLALLVTSPWGRAQVLIEQKLLSFHLLE